MFELIGFVIAVIVMAAIFIIPTVVIGFFVMAILGTINKALKS
jgi:hypothetical protein